MTSTLVNIAVCGCFIHAMEYLRGKSDLKIDCYDDGAALALEMMLHRKKYDLILVHAPCGEGIFPLYFSYGEMERCPVRLLDDPMCMAARIELEMLIKEIREAAQCNRFLA